MSNFLKKNLGNIVFVVGCAFSSVVGVIVFILLTPQSEIDALGNTFTESQLLHLSGLVPVALTQISILVLSVLFWFLYPIKKETKQ